MLKKTLVGLALAAPLFAFAAPTTFSNVPLGGAKTFDFEQIQISGGNSAVTLTDANMNGVLDAGDTFVETGLVAGVGFTDSLGNVLIDTGLNSSGGYQLFAVFNPLGGQVIAGGAIAPGIFSYVVGFAGTSGFDLYYDTDLSAGLQGSNIIGRGSNGRGTCSVNSISQSGDCVLTFDFDAAAVSAAGVFTQMGVDIGTLDASVRVDMNVDAINPSFFSPTYSVVGGTQNRSLNHNGSASFTVPEPSSLALLGLAGLAGMARRRKAA
ncbi:PEP-CTERM sorting domain-containing protein [Zoogloea sp.]|uniref:PEP-CTERM sorting domain-containing protein n=1 Tax=Zoogloea sp. TaxID=49181 RepID=UPI001AC297AA|nr:PEP-CTERM sorting domain-containing protein [Zoogloea sp.]MBN8281784.1 PEP-CTERM sorting domain-containing protein [Zoogloea sp.]